jgi:cell wall assembly regulator SMI1
MKPIWERIETWLADHARSVLLSLAPGATDEQLRAFESELGRPLPEDIALSYRIHNGQHMGRGVSDRFIYGDQLYPLSKILQRWDGPEHQPSGLDDSGMIRPVGPVKPIWDSPHRLPIAGDDSTHYYFLDFDPAACGHVGQIVLSFHDDPRIVCVAQSFRAWLEDFADQLEAGRYIFSPRRNGLIPIEWSDS